jgi:hypothetical protein
VSSDPYSREEAEACDLVSLVTNRVSSAQMIPGDRIRLARPHLGMIIGDEGVVAGFASQETGELVVAHFDGRTETIPARSLTLATSPTPARLRVSWPSTLE